MKKSLAFCRKEKKLIQYLNKKELFQHIHEHEDKLIYIPDELLKEFIFETYIAFGGVGSVFKVKSSETGQNYALKLLRQKYALQEIFFKDLKSEYIIKIHRTILCEKDMVAIIMDLAETSLDEYLKYLKKTSNINLEKIIKLFLQICYGVKYLHEHKIIHRDIKPQNILIINDSAKLCDFGIARVVNTMNTIDHTGSIIGTPGYMAPELKMGKPQFKASGLDTHCLGKTLEKMIFGLNSIEIQMFQEIIRSNIESFLLF